jgi:hypothetical protein
MMWVVAFLLLALTVFVCYTTPVYFTLVSYFFLLVLPTSFMCFFAYFSNGFFYGTLYFKVSGNSLEVHDWKLKTGKESGALQRDLVACFPDVLKSGASYIVIKSHIFGKLSDKRLRGLMDRQTKRLGLTGLTYEVLPHTRVGALSRWTMRFMRIPQRSQYEAGYRISLLPDRSR